VNDILNEVNQEGLKAVLRALEALDDKRLISMALWSKTENCGCLLGAIYPKSREIKAHGLVGYRESGWFWTKVDEAALAQWGESMSLTPVEAASLQTLNDSIHLSAEDRYVEVLRALKEAVSDDP
jgi:hypothetical protein